MRRISKYTYFLNKLLEVTKESHIDYHEIKSALKVFNRLQERFLTVSEKRAPTSTSAAAEVQFLKYANYQCGDCGSTVLTQLSTTLGMLLCADCGYHHDVLLPSNISVVVPIGEEALSRAASWVHHPMVHDILALAKSTSNITLNSIWEQNLEEGRKPEASDTSERKRDYIIQKYKHRKYYSDTYGYEARVQDKRALVKKWQWRLVKVEV